MGEACTLPRGHKRRPRLQNIIALAACAVAAGVVPSPTSQARLALRVVHYRGLTLQVPSAWPVFRLSAASHTCVRFNRHAVYLGTPSVDQVCPANALGRTEAILAQPGEGPSAPSSIPVAAGGEFRLVRDGVTVTATWGSNPGVVEQALGLHSLPQAPAETETPSAWSMAIRTHSTDVRSTASAVAAADTGNVGLSPYTGLAFDTCSSPTSAQLSAWQHSPYHGMGVYIGGANAGCAQPNLTSSWISSVTGAGWHLLLIYVGLQAPKNSCGCAPIHLASAAAEGTAAADDAAGRAAALGVRPGSPVYFDMEGYTERSPIRTAVLNFLAAWTTELHHDGYRSGVYSSASSGIADLVGGYGTGYPEPDDLWDADWNGQASTTASYIPSGDWGNHQRAHQFLGPHNLKYGGLKMNVDSDYVDGATIGQHALSVPPPSGSPGPHAKPPTSHKKSPHSKHGGHHHHSRWPRPTPQPGSPTGNGALVEVRGSHTVYRIVGGAPVLVKYLSDIGGRQPVRQISRSSLRKLRSVPANGSVVYTATGTAYRIAGGFPFVLMSPADPGSGAQLIDLWDLNHLSEPQVHLKATPNDGTVVKVAPSGRLWAFEGGHAFPARHSRDAVPVPGTDLGPWLAGCTQAGHSSGGSGLGGACWPADGNGSPSGGNTGGSGLPAALA